MGLGTCGAVRPRARVLFLGLGAERGGSVSSGPPAAQEPSPPHHQAQGSVGPHREAGMASIPVPHSDGLSWRCRTEQTACVGVGARAQAAGLPGNRPGPRQWCLASSGPGAPGSNTHALPLAKSLSVDRTGDGVLRGQMAESQEGEKAQPGCPVVLSNRGWGSPLMTVPPGRVLSSPWPGEPVALAPLPQDPLGQPGSPAPSVVPCVPQPGLPLSRCSLLTCPGVRVLGGG